MTDNVAAYVHRPGEARALWFLGGLVTWKATNATTHGHFELTEQRGRRGFAAPVHVHEQEAEGFYVLDGEMTFVLGDDRQHVPAGAFVFVPPATPHAFVVESAEARFLTIVTPPGRFEAFVEEIAESAPSRDLPPADSRTPDIARIDAAAARNGQQIMGPPPAPSYFPLNG